MYIHFTNYELKYAQKHIMPKLNQMEIINREAHCKTHNFLKSFIVINYILANYPMIKYIVQVQYQAVNDQYRSYDNRLIHPILTLT